MTFDQYVAAFALGRLGSTGLRAAAMRAVEEGRESAHLAALAGTIADERTTWECEELWYRGLDEIGVTVPAREEAGYSLRRYLAAQVNRGVLEPRTGAGEIVALARELDDVLPDRELVGDGFGVTELVGLYYSYCDEAFDYREGLNKQIDAEIIEECRRLAG